MQKDTSLPPTTLVIFGITGDLSRRYILPALTALDQSGHLPASFKLLGLSRGPITPEEVLPAKAKCLGRYLHTRQMDMAKPQDYAELKSALDPAAHTIFYFAVPPAAVLPIVRNMGQAGLNGPNIKLLLEKPFGVDLESAGELITQTQEYFSEDQLYRIDHYLAKGMTQNIAVFLSSNALVRNVWSNQFIDYIEIVVAEKIDIEGRAAFYEHTGALRDMVQSHLLQLAALTLMEPCPDPFDFTDLPQRRYKALSQLVPPTPDKLATQAIRAQYMGYAQEVGNPDSTAETFVALQLTSQSPRWAGVPIYLATGKNLDERLSQIRVNFKKINNSEANQLVIRIQPEEGIEVDIWARQPGYRDELQKKALSFSYQQDFDGRIPDAYEQVLFDAMRSRSNLFASSAEVLETWRILQPVINHWAMAGNKIHIYKPGSSVEQILEKNS